MLHGMKRQASLMAYCQGAAYVRQWIIRGFWWRSLCFEIYTMGEEKVYYEIYKYKIYVFHIQM